MTKEEILSLSQGEQVKLAKRDTSLDVLDALSYSPYIDVKRYLLRNKHTSKETLWRLYNLGNCISDDFLIRSKIVTHPNAPEEMLIQWNAEKWYLNHPLLKLV